jgi:hypothetical protein
MPPKTLKYWERLWNEACAYDAAYFHSGLTLDQFCASHRLDESDRNQLLAYFMHAGVMTA